ncbi:MAG: DUF4160 domain-containing protein [Desulfotignum sp.]|nr:DUF4160 domain-containing protein [Desulfotignum sp.]MCF8089663.1 DUF4160 domain-containing protein [Desulfotignum sp.]MCF8138811.1 DUF4160 domain-containing protein [Desulfotignum sp.]
MAIISMFYGIIILMYFFDDKQHHMPHIHVKYQDREACYESKSKKSDSEFGFYGHPYL